jgi:hypothetical protein
MYFNKSTTAKSTYIPPTVRNQTALSSTKKKEPQKVFSLDNSLFPSLGENYTANSPLSFSSAAAKKIEQPKLVKAEVAPGWVHIRRRNGKTEYKYGIPVPIFDNREREEMIFNNMLFKIRMEEQQYERDMDVLRLGDLSEYYGEPTLAEIHDYEMRNKNNDKYYSSSSSDESDDDY